MEGFESQGRFCRMQDLTAAQVSRGKSEAFPGAELRDTLGPAEGRSALTLQAHPLVLSTWVLPWTKAVSPLLPVLD